MWSNCGWAYPDESQFCTVKPLHCDFCGYSGELVFVHSHYQCPRCGINVAPCCQGEQCEYLDEDVSDTESAQSDPAV